VVAFSRSGGRAALQRSKSVRVLPITAPEADADSSIAELAELIERLTPAAVLPLDDGALWLVARAANETGVDVVGPVGSQAEFALDKRLQLSVAREAGFKVLETKIVDAGNVDSSDVTYPVYARPALAVDATGPRLTHGRGAPCANRDQLERLLAARDSSPFLLQPLISGVTGGLFGLATLRGVGALTAHRRVRMVSPSGSGSSACAPAAVLPELLGPTERLVASVGWRGMFMIEYLVDADKTPWFIEFNGRAWGSMALARDVGFEYPAWAAKQVVVDPDFAPAEPPSIDHGLLCRHLGREIVHLVRVLRGPGPSVADWPSRWSTLRAVASVRHGDRWYNDRRGERSVLAADTYITLRQLLKR
jgi:hypothetical protein